MAMTSITKRITINSASHGGAVVARTLATFISIPVLLGSLGEDLFGLWMVSISFIGIIGFGQNAMAAALINQSANATSKDELEVQLTSAFILNGLIAVAIVPISVMIAFFIPWLSLFDLKAGQVSGDDLSYLIFVLVASLGLSFLASIPTSFAMGRLQGYAAWAIDIAATIFATSALLAAAISNQPLWILAFCYAAGRQLVTLALGCAYLVRSLNLRIFSLGNIREASIKAQLKAGGLLTLSGFSHAISVHSDLPIIGFFDKPSGAADFAILQRLYLIPVTLSQLLSTALWPAFSQANSQGDVGWIARTFLQTTSALLIFAVSFSSALFISIDWLLSIWLGSETNPMAPALVIGMTIWSVLAVFVFSCDNLFKALGRLKALSTLHLGMATVNLPLSIILVIKIGPAGAIWGTVIAYSLCLVIPYLIMLPRVLLQRKR